MPTTFVGLLLFVLLLAPGLTYRMYRAPRTSVQRLSALREVGGVVLRSAAFDGLALAVFGIVRASYPDGTPNVGSLVRSHDAYLDRHYVSALWWSVAAVLFACALAIASAHFVGSDTAQKWRTAKPLSWLLPRGTVTDDPAWRIVLEAHRGKRAFVGLALNDGHYIDGYLWTSSPDTDETTDRDMALQEPRLRRPNTDGQPQDMDADAVVVSARNINFITVTYLDPPPPNGQSPQPPAPAPPGNP